MTKDRHTPGPWRAGPNRGNASWRITGPTGEDIADTGIWSLEHRDEMIANARLIAAAPLMLEALEMVMQHGRIDNSEARMTQVAAALSAARGEGE